jgi:hypothetical protein
MAKKAAKKAKKARKPSTEMTVQEELEALQEQWEGAEAKSQYSEVPDARYHGVISEAAVGRSKTSNRLQVSWDVIISEGDFENWHVWKYDGLEGEESLDWLMTTLEALDLEAPDDLSDLPGILAEAVGLEIEFDVKTKNEFQNVYFREAIGSADLETEEEEEEEEDSYSVGDRVVVEIDGEDFPGEITSIDEDDADVKFDDGDTGTYSMTLDSFDLESEEQSDGEEEEDDTYDPSTMTKAECTEYLDEEEIEYPSKAKLAALRKLVEEDLEEGE